MNDAAKKRERKLERYMSKRISTFDMTKRERRIYKQGLLDALELVEEWDKYVLHHVRLSDALRLKLNLIMKRDVRKHPIIA